MWVIAVLVVGGIVLLSLGPDPLRHASDSVKSLRHLVAYAVVVLVLLSIPAHVPRGLWCVAWLFLAAAAALGLGVLLEMGQASVGRDSDPGDVEENLVGIFLGSAVWLCGRWIASGLRRFTAWRAALRARGKP